LKKLKSEKVRKKGNPYAAMVVMMMKHLVLTKEGVSSVC